MSTVQTIPAQKEPSSFRLIATLGVAGFFSGVVLVGAFILTEPVILANKAERLSKAIYKVLPGCVAYTPLVLEGDVLQPLPEGTELGQEGVDPQVFAGYDEEGDLIGFAVTSKEPGFQDIIGGIFGFDPKAEVIIGMEILESKETPGLGDKIFKDAAFQTNFEALSTKSEIEAVKKGEKEKDFQVEAITGATISSKAVVRMLNKGMGAWGEAMHLYVETGEGETE